MSTLSKLGKHVAKSFYRIDLSFVLNLIEAWPRFFGRIARLPER